MSFTVIPHPSTIKLSFSLFNLVEIVKVNNLFGLARSHSIFFIGLPVFLIRYFMKIHLLLVFTSSSPPPLFFPCDHSFRLLLTHSHIGCISSIHFCIFCIKCRIHKGIRLISLKFFLILSSHLRLDLRRTLFRFTCQYFQRTTTFFHFVYMPCQS